MNVIVVNLPKIKMGMSAANQTSNDWIPDPGIKSITFVS
jgi:hypothetical protein